MATRETIELSRDPVNLITEFSPALSRGDKYALQISSGRPDAVVRLFEGTAAPADAVKDREGIVIIDKQIVSFEIHVTQNLYAWASHDEGVHLAAQETP